MIEKMEIHKGDFVTYYDGGYKGKIISEDGEMEVWDWHVYASGKVLCTCGNKALIWFYSHISEYPKPANHIILNELYVDWVELKYLAKSEPMETLLFFEYESDYDHRDCPDDFNPELYNL